MAAIARHFAELGADVVRIEAAAGGSDRSMGIMAAGVSLDFVAANLGKRSAPSAQLSDLARTGDILIAPMNTVDADALSAVNPRLVVVTVSDFGDTAGYRDWTGSGPVYHALTAELSRSGVPGRPPLLPPAHLATACAAVQAAYVALLAYYNALRTGVGDHLDFSVLDGAAQALDPGYGAAGSASAGTPASELPRGRAEARHLYPIIPCKDGFVRLCVLAPRQWRGMFEWLGKPEEFADPIFQNLQARFASKTLIPAIAKLFAQKTRRELEEAGSHFGVPAAALLDLDEALACEQIEARRVFVPVEIAPGVMAPFPDGVLEIDGARMGIVGPAPGRPEAPVTWYPRNPMPAAPGLGDRPLAGLRVLDFGVIVVGAESGRLLADQGADVIKIESAAFPDGLRQTRNNDVISQSFAAGHRNQRSLGINVRDPEGKALLLKLIATTDVLLSNFKGGTLESLGLDFASLKAINPRIIVTDSSAFGPTGPWAKRLGYGPLVRAAAGLTMQWRYPGEPDSFSDAITVYPDHVAGRIGVIGVLALLIRRLRTGRGGAVSISQADVMLSHMAPRIAGDALSRAGFLITPDPQQSDVYACAGDDEWCVVTQRDTADAARIASVTGGLALAEWLAARSPKAAMVALQAAGVPAAAMLRVSELPDFPYYVERRLFRDAHHPHITRPFKVEAAPVRSKRLPDPPEHPAPLMSEQTVMIASVDLGLSADRIDQLVAGHVLEPFTMPEDVKQ
jgi:crotonobetainyl-CoA:carnitine CoA-transferase CaiB-like acyl-CoA transferase